MLIDFIHVRKQTYMIRRDMASRGVGAFVAMLSPVFDESNWVHVERDSEGLECRNNFYLTACCSQTTSTSPTTTVVQQGPGPMDVG